MALAALLFTGCAMSPALQAQRESNMKDPLFITAWNQCLRETRDFSLIPDYGITWEGHFFKCMEQAGWVQTPRWNARAIERYHRAP